MHFSVDFFYFLEETTERSLSFELGSLILSAFIETLVLREGCWGNDNSSPLYFLTARVGSFNYWAISVLKLLGEVGSAVYAYVRDVLAAIQAPIGYSIYYNYSIFFCIKCPKNRITKRYEDWVLNILKVAEKNSLIN